MFVQLEKGESIDKREIIGIFDMETASISQNTRDIFKRKEEEKGVISVCNDLPKAFLLCDNEYTDRIYITGLSVESIRKRIETEKGVKILWKK